MHIDATIFITVISTAIFGLVNLSNPSSTGQMDTC